ncbi:MAG: ABC transporter permease [Dehalococcoidia bacterium]
MSAYVARRLLWLIPVLLGVAVVTFALMHAVPGGPWDREKPLPPEVVANLNQRYGLDQPLWRQFADYLGGLSRGDLGVSCIQQDRPVASIIADGLQTSATLGMLALAAAVVVGVGLGVAAAVHKDGPLDFLSVLLATLGASAPSFVLGILLVVLFSVQLHWLPTGGWGSPRQAVMPVIALSALPAAFIARVTRASMLEVLRQDYIMAARSRGLREWVLLYRHALRNALIPVLTVLGPVAAALVTGSFIVETLFSIPGTGRLFVDGVFARDYGLIMGATLFYTAVVTVANLAVDLLYAVVDPRIRYV